jgi:ElaB/YqjD/DUF883 family membrane-anchored ribosome-binding protein
MSDRTSSRVKDSILGKNNEASIEDIQADLASLREDLSRLTEEIGSALAAKGASTWRTAKESIKANLDDALAGAESTKDDAVDAVHGVSDAIVGAVEEAIARRPYPALAVAAVLGFFCGMALKK